MASIAVAAMAVCLAMPLQAQESSESSSERAAAAKPKAGGHPGARIRVRLVTAEQAGPPVRAFAPGESILAAEPDAGSPVNTSAESPPPPSAAGAVVGPSLFDQLVAPSWSGGGGFDRAPWPEDGAGDDSATQPGADGEVVRVIAASSPSPEAAGTSTPLPGAAGSGQPGSLAPVAGGDYRLGPGDRVDVFVWRNSDLSRVVPVRPDGRITLPLAGEIIATGKTVSMLQEEITARLSDYVQMPTVTVTLAEIRSLVIYVLGDVRTPGAVQMDRNLTVLQAIAAAGGLNEFADRNDIVVMRTSADGVHQRWTFRYDDVVEGKQLNSNIVLQAGDTIIVP